jgi:hypothetical protein
VVKSEMAGSLMNSHVLTPDTQAILLLCGSLGLSRAREAPLTQVEYNQVAQWLQREQLWPADLLQPEGVDRVRATGSTLPLGNRVVDLVSRGAALALAVEAWTNKGLWVISRSDTNYPRLLRTRLGFIKEQLHPGRAGGLRNGSRRVYAPGG